MLRVKLVKLSNLSHTLFLGLAIYFPHCYGYWSGRTSDLQLETNGCSPSLTLVSFNGVLPVLVEDHVDLHTVVGKERCTDDVVVLFGKLTKGTCSGRLGHLYDSHAVDDYNSWIW